MKTKYFPPVYKANGFHCPHCDVLAEQTWYRLDALEFGKSSGIGVIPNLSLALCRRCKKYSVWQNEKIIYPVFSIAPMPSDDMPEDTKADYLEARLIVNYSPRAACALLRLGLQKLMINLGEKGRDLNTDIKELVAKGLPPRIQKALDSVRVIGNEAVHPGELDLKDDAETATAIFSLLNMIVDVMITQPKEVDNLYEKLPNGKKEQIVKRDKS
jgi:hypothetical protein